MVPQEASSFSCSWHYEHLVYQAQAKHKRAQQRERAFVVQRAPQVSLATSSSTQSVAFDKLDSIGRASSLVEMVNSLIRPYLNSCKGQITQETLNLIMFYQNHRRYKSGKRQAGPHNS